MVPSSLSALSPWPSSPLWVLTFLSGSHSLGSAEFVPFFVLIFPFWAWAIVMMNARAGRSSTGRSRFDLRSRQGGPRLSWRMALGELPRWAKATFIGLPIVGGLGIISRSPVAFRGNLATTR